MQRKPFSSYRRTGDCLSHIGWLRDRQSTCDRKRYAETRAWISVACLNADRAVSTADMTAQNAGGPRGFDESRGSTLFPLVEFVAKKTASEPQRGVQSRNGAIFSDAGPPRERRADTVFALLCRAMPNGPAMPTDRSPFRPDPIPLDPCRAPGD